MSAASAAMAAWLASVALADWRARRITNRRILAGGAIAALALAAGMRPADLLPTDAVGAGVLAFCVLMPSYLVRAMGAADVKLGAVLGLWFGMQPLPYLWVAASLLAAAHGAACLMAIRARTAGAPAGAQRRPRKVPFGSYLALAALGAQAVLP
ncbi:MAG: A24 family peptidase [Xylophilus ampelinus]